MWLVSQTPAQTAPVSEVTLAMLPLLVDQTTALGLEAGDPAESRTVAVKPWTWPWFNDEAEGLITMLPGVELLLLLPPPQPAQMARVADKNMRTA
jgi:hypothetical protein